MAFWDFSQRLRLTEAPPIYPYRIAQLISTSSNLVVIASDSSVFVCAPNAPYSIQHKLATCGEILSACVMGTPDTLVVLEFVLASAKLQVGLYDLSTSSALAPLTSIPLSSVQSACVAACPGTSRRVLTSQGSTITLWDCASLPRGEPIPILEVSATNEFPVITKLALFGDYLAFGYLREVRVLFLQIGARENSKTERRSAGCFGEGPIAPSFERALVPMVSPLMNPSRAFKSSSPSMDSSLVTRVQAPYYLLRCSCLIHRRYVSRDEILTFQFLLVPADLLNTSLKPPSPSSEAPTMRLLFFVSSFREGTVYDALHGQSIKVFDYHLPAVQVLIDRSFLYLLTSQSLFVSPLCLGPLSHLAPKPPVLCSQHMAGRVLECMAVLGENVFLASRLAESKIDAEVKTPLEPPSPGPLEAAAAAVRALNPTEVGNDGCSTPLFVFHRRRVAELSRALTNRDDKGALALSSHFLLFSELCAAFLLKGIASTAQVAVLKALYTESFGYLGDFTSVSDQRLAAECFALSDRAVDSVRSKLSDASCLADYYCHLLQQPTKQFQTALDGDLAVSILSHLKHHCPEKFPGMFLRSPLLFAEFEPERVLALFELEEKAASDASAMCVGLLKLPTDQGAALAACGSDAVLEELQTTPRLCVDWRFASSLLAALSQPALRAALPEALLVAVTEGSASVERALQLLTAPQQTRRVFLENCLVKLVKGGKSEVVQDVLKHLCELYQQVSPSLSSSLPPHLASLGLTLQAMDHLSYPAHLLPASAPTEAVKAPPPPSSSSSCPWPVLVILLPHLLPLKECLDYFVSNQPCHSLLFAKLHLGTSNPGQWQEYLTLLMKRACVGQAESGEYVAVLSQLASSLSPQAFLPILPASASLNFHMPFIKLCMQKQGLLNLPFST